MKTILQTPLVLTATLAVALLTACGGNGSTPASPPASQVPSTMITTHVTTAGTTGPWKGASLSGGATPNTYTCVPGQDQNCVVNFGGTLGAVLTDSNGQYILQSDALGGVEWSFAAVDASNDSTCPNGASDTDTPNVGGNTDLFCNQNNAVAVVASPSSCITTTDTTTGQSNSNCPSTITLTAALPIFPTGYAINASSYTEAEALVVSNSITASSSTTITVPTPATTGFSAVVFTDPTTNLVLGAASFENIQRTTTTACTGHVCGVQP
jgi:hypothetical protein